MPFGEMMQTPAEDSDIGFETDFAQRVALEWDRYLGSRLLGIYLIGSLAHGGFGPRYSDIDVAVVLSNALSTADITEMNRMAAEVSRQHAAKLSLFWTDRGFAIGRFPPLDRIDFLKNAVKLLEREAVRPGQPSLAEVRAYLRGAPFERWAAKAREFSVASELRPEEHKQYLRALLYPARFIYSWLLGDIASNDDAVLFLQDHAPAGIDVNLICKALRCRREGRDPDDLFGARSTLRAHVEVCMGIIADYEPGKCDQSKVGRR